MELTFFEYDSPVPSPTTRRTMRLETFEDSLSLDDLVRKLSVTQGPVVIFVNSQPVKPADLSTRVVVDYDVVEVMPVAQEPVSSALITYFALEGVAAAIVTIAVNVAAAYVINRLTSSSQTSSTQERRGLKDQTSYGLAGGTNTFRQLQPLPLVLGSTRVFPDYGSPWIVDYVHDARDPVSGLSPTPNFEQRAVPPFTIRGLAEGSPVVNAPWSTVAGGYAPNPIGDYHNNLVQGTLSPYSGTYYYGDNQPRSYIHPEDGLITVPHTFVIRVSPTGVDVISGDYLFTRAALNPYTFGIYTVGMTLPVILNYEMSEPSVTQRLSCVFNYGFGDLDYSDDTIGTTPITNYNQYFIYNAVHEPTRSYTDQWRRAPTMLAGPVRRYPDNCEMVDGGQLQQNTSVPNSGWIERRSTRRLANYIEIDLAGRLGRNGAAGPDDLQAQFEIQYRLVGGGGWLVAPGVGAYTATSGRLLQLYKRSLGFAVVAGWYETRIRKLTADVTDPRDVCDFACERIKFYQDDAPEAYVAQNRRGLQIVSSPQLNGTLDRFSTYVRAKTWVWVGGAYDGSTPGSNIWWAWGTTRNPAWWVLYFAAGGYLNSTPQPGHPLNGKGWMLGSAPGNTELLFGLGRRWSRIDVARIIQFADYCRTHDLEFSEIVDKQSAAFEVIEDIARVGRGSISEAGGLLSVVWSDPQDPVTSVFGMGNIVAGSFSIAYRSEQTYELVRLGYKNREKFFSPDYAEASVPGSSTVTRIGTISSWGIDRPSQAAREANLEAARQVYFDAVYTWEAGVYGSRVWRRDVVQLAHDLTQWAHSGRVFGFEVANDRLTYIELDQQIDATGSGDYFIYVLLPSGATRSIQVIRPAAATSRLQVVGAFDLAELPLSLDQSGTHNPLSQYAHETSPADFAYLAGPTATPGRKVRVVDVQPSGDSTVRIVAVAEDAAFYSQEYSLSAPALPPPGALNARAHSPMFIKRDDEFLWLEWELENATAADVSLSINGATEVPLTASMTVAGTSIKLPQRYPVGTHIKATVSPRVGALGINAINSTAEYTEST